MQYFDVLTPFSVLLMELVWKNLVESFGSRLRGVVLESFWSRLRGCLLESFWSRCWNRFVGNVVESFGHYYHGFINNLHTPRHPLKGFPKTPP